MPAPLRSPKTLADWLDLGYVERPRFFRRLWKLAVIAALLASLAGVAWALLPGNRTALQAGPVSTAHALFNNDCGQCHTGSYRTLYRFVTHDATVRAVPNEACKKCHPGPVHHTEQVREGACAVCHREHHGHAALARVADEHCLACHRDLPHGSKPGVTLQFQKDVASWAAHPDFARGWNKDFSDPGTLRFNHAAHLQPAGVFTLDGKQIALQGDKPEESEKAKKTLHCG